MGVGSGKASSVRMYAASQVSLFQRRIVSKRSGLFTNH